ncbi:hypothetical protein AFLA_011116 [Aspergillus flavus NRRL3357]|nr:hypothetical protein AFLA_011116 [Aspergillus flavus NRRL3357]
MNISEEHGSRIDIPDAPAMSHRICTLTPLSLNGTGQLVILQPEIHGYFSGFADKHGFRDLFSCNHRVVGANWDDVLGRSMEGCSIPRTGMDLLPLTGKRVGLIGNGSSGIQLLPELQRTAGHGIAFMRRPTWVIPEMRYKQRRYTDEEKQTLRDNLRKLLQLRKDIEANYTTLLPLFLKDTSIDSDVVALHTNYLESLTKPNVKPVFGNIKEYNTVWRHYARRQRPLANSPLIICIEAQEHYIAKFLNRWQKEDIRTFEPKLEAVDDFMEQKDLLMKSTIWENDCRSWFRKRQHRQAVAVQRFEDFYITYATKNRFTYLGNGFSQTHLQLESDLTY